MKQPIIIKRVEDDGHDAHHGGGWKVAYADFMTAMMAFFLLLWILAASDEEKLRGLADYFTPSLSEAGGRGDGLLQGMVLGPTGVLSGTDGPQSEVVLPSFGQENPLSVFDSRLRDVAPAVVVEYVEGADSAELSVDPDAAAAETPAQDLAASQEVADRIEAERVAELDAIEADIREAMAAEADLADLSGNILIDQTADGLQVQIVDEDGREMFASGSARIEDKTRHLVEIIAQAIADLPYPLAISGHTDSVPFTRRAGYSNWELSSDRANATRRIMAAAGIAPNRFLRISGLADTALLDPENPKAPQNRRISIQLLHPRLVPDAP